MSKNNLINIIRKELNLAEQYLFEHLGPDSLWRDFYSNTHKESVDWASGFVGDFLLSSGIDKNRLRKTADALASRQDVDGGWRYNEITFSTDADTTSNVFSFLSHFEDRYAKQLNLAKQYILNHQRSSGGFATYNKDEARRYSRLVTVESVDGWCVEIPDVTVRVVGVLRKFSDADDAVSNAMSYLTKEQRSDGGWNCYWWNNDVYSTALCVTLMNGKVSARGRDWLKRNISDIPFYDALSLTALADDKPYDTLFGVLLFNLLNSQNSDGSWSSGNILKFPHPSNTMPWNDNRVWRGEMPDQNNLFTTSTVYHALSTYLKAVGE